MELQPNTIKHLQAYVAAKIEERGLDMEAEYRKKEAEIDRRTYERSQKV